MLDLLVKQAHKKIIEQRDTYLAVFATEFCCIEKITTLVKLQTKKKVALKIISVKMQTSKEVKDIILSMLNPNENPEV